MPIVLAIPMYMVSLPIPFFNAPVGYGFFAFFIGMYIGMILPKTRNLNLTLKILIKVLALGICATYVYLFVTYPEYTGETIPLHLGQPTGVLFFGVPLIVLLYNIKPLNYVCNLKFMNLLTDISFDFYLTHAFVLLCFYPLMFDSFSGSIEGLLAMISATIVFSIITHYLVNVLWVKHLKKRFDA